MNHHSTMWRIILFLIIMTCASNTFAEWQVLSPKESGRLIELDTFRSKKLINNYVAFARTYLSDQRVEIKTEINCASKKHKLLFQYVTDKNGNLIHESKKPKSWEQIPPDSVFEVLMNHLCK